MTLSVAAPNLNDVGNLNYSLITSENDLRAAVEELRTSHAIGVDTETTGFEPHSSQIRLVQLASPEKSYVIDTFQFNALNNAELRALLESPRPIKALHNAKFDFKMLKYLAGIEMNPMFDSMLADILILAGERGSHSLAACCERYLDTPIDKTMQSSNWAGPLSNAQLEYAGLDAVMALRLREKQIDRLRELQLVNTAKLEFDCIAPIAMMELNGINLNADMWRALVKNVESSHSKLADELRAELAAGVVQQTLFGDPDINLDSPSQVLDAINRITGLDIDATRSTSLQPLAAQYPVIQKLIEYRAAQKSLTSYGENVLTFINKKTQRIHADFFQIGAPTGRLSCHDPNLQQVPNSVEYRSCFTAPPGRKLIIADYSQIELRILAEFSQDASLLEAFRTGIDLHRMTASQMLSIPFDDITKEQRDAAKALNFGLIYGMGAQGLSNRINTSIEESERLIQKYFSTYSGVHTWLTNAGDTAIRDHKCRTRLGRLWSFNFDSSDRSAVAAYVRAGKNFPIQGTNADITKRALVLMYSPLQEKGAMVVNCVHDEIVVEASQESAQEVAATVERLMIQAGTETLQTVPVAVNTVVADSWTK